MYMIRRCLTFTINCKAGGQRDREWEMALGYQLGNSCPNTIAVHGVGGISNMVMVLFAHLSWPVTHMTCTSQGRAHVGTGLPLCHFSHELKFSQFMYSTFSCTSDVQTNNHKCTCSMHSAMTSYLDYSGITTFPCIFKNHFKSVPGGQHTALGMV